MLLIKKIIYGVNGLMLRVAMLLTLLMVFVTVADVLGRLFFTQIPGVFELTRLTLGVIVFTSLGWSQINKVHIAINLFVSRIPFIWQNLIDVFNYLVASVTFSLAFWQMLKYADRLYNVKQVTAVLGIPIHPWVFISAVGVLFFTLVLIWDLIVAVSKLFGRGTIDEYRSHWSS
jgi:TRAP-type transport system small permease protein